MNFRLPTGIRQAHEAILHELAVTRLPVLSEEGKKISWRDGFAAIYTLLDQRVRG